MQRPVQFTVGLILFLALEILRVYFIMPFPGSQQDTTIDIAYFLHRNIFWFRTIAILILIVPAMQYYVMGRIWSKVVVTLCLILAITVFYMTNYRLQADKMFLEPTSVKFANATSSSVKPGQLVLGVEIGGVAKAYPIQFIGYHHQVRDRIGNEEVMITYCTVCRTGRAYSPVVDGRAQNFRLVGMDHFNAMFEDQATGSWWRQVSGEAIAGEHKGKQLREFATQQLTLSSWLSQFPNSMIMEPDTTFNEQYEKLLTFDRGNTKSELIRRDSLSWKEKSWVVGVALNNSARAYDWNTLVDENIIQDTLSGVPVLLTLESDTASFHVWQRDSLTFVHRDGNLIDRNTNSVWSPDGKAMSGPLQGRQLKSIQSYQEFWHSWRTFHPTTTRYPKE